ncbi:MAG: hypothetical protein WD114_00915 [Phycisphaerales bacterium]
MVSLAVISVLIALMFPAITMVRESTRRVICGSNLRQLGMGVSIYAQDHKDRLPGSVFLPPQHSNAASFPAYDRMDTVWLSREEFPGMRNDLWDGLGYLYGEEYIAAANLYYCPSHHGGFTFEEASDDWAQLDPREEIIINYLYRGTGPQGARVLYKIPSSAALVTDTLRSYNDLNHEGGFNVLQAGLAVNWFEDIGGEIAQGILMRTDDDNPNHSSTVQNAWGRLDQMPGGQD